MRMTKTLAAAAIAAFSAAFAGDYDVAAIIWPAYQNEPRWKELGIFGDGKGEWQSVYEAVPRFEGHDQPMKPLWGYEMDDDPKAMARQIDAALAAGINVFIYDWYWYCGKPFLESALDNGFLKAPNNERMRFYIMWANHDVDYLWNSSKAVKRADPPLWSAAVTEEEFREKLVPRFIGYFKRPNYYKIDGKPVFWIFSPDGFAKGIGGLEKARAALDYLRRETVKAGFPGLHLQLNEWGIGDLAPEGWSRNAGARALGADSVTLYNTGWHAFPPDTDWSNGGPRGKNGEALRVPYSEMVERSIEAQKYLRNDLDVPFFPNVTIGWDNNPRFPPSVSLGYVTNATPKVYGEYLRRMKKWLDDDTSLPAKLLLINAWNEWTEGCVLQPTETHGYGYLNATAEVFANH